MLVTWIRRDLYASTVNFNDVRLYCHFQYLDPELCRKSREWMECVNAVAQVEKGLSSRGRVNGCLLGPVKDLEQGISDMSVIKTNNV